MTPCPNLSSLLHGRYVSIILFITPVFSFQFQRTSRRLWADGPYRTLNVCYDSTLAATASACPWRGRATAMTIAATTPTNCPTCAKQVGLTSMFLRKNVRRLPTEWEGGWGWLVFGSVYRRQIRTRWPGPAKIFLRLYIIRIYARRSATRVTKDRKIRRWE